MNSELRDRYLYAQEFAVEGGKSTLEFFQNRDLKVDRKGDDSPVTVADRNAEKLIRAEIEARFPDDGIVGEEFGESPGSSGYRWILDPIDGTKSFISGVPLFGTMIGIEVETKPTIGAIYFPGLDEGIFGCVGEPTVFGRGDQMQEAKVADTAKLSDSIFVTSEAKTFAERGAGDVYRQLEDASYVTRTWGDAYGYYLVATGRIELMVDPILSIWDAAAVLPILVGAGGVFCDWAGEPRIDAGEAIGATPGIAEEVLQITRRYAGKFDN